MKNKRGKKKSSDQQSDSSEISQKASKKKEVKNEQFLERWKDASQNKMGNDIAGEINIANSKGQLEGGKDKRWHLEEEE